MNEARALLLSENEGDVRRGVALVLELEAKGDALARYAVATWHIHGAYGYTVDVEKGISMLSGAADKLQAEALYDLGYLTRERKLTDRPSRSAFGYYLAAALLGDQDALAELYKCLYWGIGVYRDRSIASLVRKIALAKGVPEADL